MPSEAEMQVILRETAAAGQAAARQPTVADAIAALGEDAVRYSADGRRFKIQITNERWDAEKNRHRWGIWTELSRPWRRAEIERSKERDARRPMMRLVNTRTGEVREVPAEVEALAARRGGWRPHRRVRPLAPGTVLGWHGRPASSAEPAE